MIEIRHVLFPTDLSEESRAALPYAVQAAQSFGAVLHILYVQEIHTEPHALRDFPGYSDLSEALDQRTTEVLEALVETRPGDTLEIHRATRRAIAAAPEILSYAGDNSIDLIVMSTHGRRGLRRLVIGSVTEEVVRNASMPVVTLRSDTTPSTHGRILVAIDLSESSKQAVHYAARLSASTGADVELFHVVEPPTVPVIYEALPEMPSIPLDDLIDEARSRLQELVVGGGLDAGHTRVGVGHGSPAEQIEKRIEEGDVQLVVLHTQPRAAFARLIHGSTAIQVLTRTSVPVLTFKTSSARGKTAEANREAHAASRG